jgi:hypothetical protein
VGLTDVTLCTTIKAFTFASREPDRSQTWSSVSRCRHCYCAESFIVMKEDREGYLADFTCHAKSEPRWLTLHQVVLATRPGCDCPEIMRIVREGFIKGHGVTVQQSALTSPKEEIRHFRAESKDEIASNSPVLSIETS